jgi:hypothetical protein
MCGLIPVVCGMVMVRSARGIVAFSTVASVLMASALLGVFGYVLQNMKGELRHGSMQSFGRLSKCARFPPAPDAMRYRRNPAAQQATVEFVWFCCAPWTMIPFANRHWSHRARGRLPLVFGNLAFAFEGIGLVLPVESAMQDSKRFRFPAVLTAAMSTVALIFLLNGLLCYMALGQIERYATLSCVCSGASKRCRVCAELSTSSQTLTIKFPTCSILSLFCLYFVSILSLFCLYFVSILSSFSAHAPAELATSPTSNITNHKPPPPA